MNRCPNTGGPHEPRPAPSGDGTYCAHCGRTLSGGRLHKDRDDTEPLRRNQPVSEPLQKPATPGEPLEK